MTEQRAMQMSTIGDTGVYKVLNDRVTSDTKTGRSKLLLRSRGTLEFEKIRNIRKLDESVKPVVPVGLDWHTFCLRVMKAINFKAGLVKEKKI